jgi:hypothetical protein
VYVGVLRNAKSEEFYVFLKMLPRGFHKVCGRQRRRAARGHRAGNALRGAVDTLSLKTRPSLISRKRWCLEGHSCGY